MKDVAIPQNIVNDAIRNFGRNFMFVYPERYFTGEDLLSGAKKPTGKRHYGICTACGKRSENVEPAPTEKSKRGPGSYHWVRPPRGYVTCPACYRLVEARNGNLDKSKLMDEFYLQAWERESKEKVILYEAVFYLGEWTDEGADKVKVYGQRKTVLTPSGAETFDYWYESWFGDKKAWHKNNISKTNPYMLPEVKREFRREKLASSFLCNLGNYCKEHVLSNDYLIRFVEEPITELFYKMGFERIATERVYKKKQTKGTIHIDFTRRSPKKMFRGVDKVTEQNMKELMKLITRKDIVSCADLEAAIMVFKKCKGASPMIVSDIFDLANARPPFSPDKLLRICTKIKDFPVARIVEYFQEHDINIYIDYIEAALVNGAPLNEARTAFPVDLNAAHDEQIEKREFYTSPETFEKCAKRAEKLKKQGYEFEYNGICTVVPEKPTDIKREGVAMCNCVGRMYTERHADGKSDIIFIRRAAEREKSWFTLELDPKTRKIRQCSGYHNEIRGQNHKEVSVFLEKYLQHLEKCFNKRKKQEENKCRITV